ncbi:acetyl-CoA carboxylase biotin carboxylase subunit [Candidatus Kapabacteria bacterium]|nr:acetyl-CoA carboxylase biotin carboxylase subunit [Candidatus Kapabacteria bacterium]
MLKKILIANRGEIACRIIKTCKKLNIKSVAIFSDADKNSLHVQLADESVYIGNSPASESYLVHQKVIDAAINSGAEAIHPGYGFLSENYSFNQKVREAGLIFIGPKPEPMRVLGSKVESRITMMNAGVPVIPGMKSASLDIEAFKTEADKMLYPVLIKASAGGGGKGMRVVHSADKLVESFKSAVRESQNAFGSDEVFLEKYIESPRHIEIQVARDQHGNAVHIFERECSIQRRHQKIIEESPSTAVSDDIRKKMGDAAIKAVEAVDYDSVATVEFLLDKSGNFYFLEVNTRIQVEHPITEMVTGVDLVELQVKIANGEKLGVAQDEIKQTGHAIECRIYAEDAENDFMPTGGKVHILKEPIGEGIRVDSGIKEGDEVTSFYDPIMAKLITYAPTRDEARLKMINALKNYICLGVKTSTRFMIDVLDHADFVSCKTYTNFIDINNEELLYHDNLSDKVSLIAANLTNQNNTIGLDNNDVWEEIGSWEIASN